MGTSVPRGQHLGTATFLRRWIGPIAVLAAFAGGAAWAAVPQAEGGKQPGIDPKARTLLERMSDFLAHQPRFTVQTDGSTEVVLQTGEKVELDYSSDIRVKRPDKLRSDRRGELADLEFFYDGRNFTLYGKNNHYYATAPAPANIDEAIDAARQKLGIEAPAADLLYSDPYKILMEDVVSGSYLGMSTVRGIATHHLAFRGNESDWQIWIEDGPNPVPVKFVIVSKQVPGLPEFTAEFSHWNFSPKLDDSAFCFTPPSNATRIDFLGQTASRGTQGVKK